MKKLILALTLVLCACAGSKTPDSVLPPIPGLDSECPVRLYKFVFRAPVQPVYYVVNANVGYGNAYTLHPAGSTVTPADDAPLMLYACNMSYRIENRGTQEITIDLYWYYGNQPGNLIKSYKIGAGQNLNDYQAE